MGRWWILGNPTHKINEKRPVSTVLSTCITRNFAKAVEPLEN
jgi:hypothetical protein